MSKDGNWAIAPYSYSTADGDVFKSDYMRCVLYAGNNSTNVLTGVEEYQIDEIAVYYKAKDFVSVTLSANGNENASDVVVNDVPVSGVYVKDLLARITNKSGKQLLGLSKTLELFLHL